MVTLFVTEKGAAMPSNSWKEGEEISCHEVIAEDFIKRGIATDSEASQPKPKKEASQPKTK